ncbi:MAG: hypothetical protein NVS3B20_20250 [Polyangiales bacterium]
MGATSPARSLGELAPHMKSEVIGLIDKSTRNSPADRWPSADAMLEEVKRLKVKFGLVDSRLLPVPSIVETPSLGGVSGPNPGTHRSPSFGGVDSVDGDRQRRSDAPTLASDEFELEEDSAARASFAKRTEEGTSTGPVVTHRRPRVVPLLVVVGSAIFVCGAAIALAATRYQRGSTVPPNGAERNSGGIVTEGATEPPATQPSPRESSSARAAVSRGDSKGASIAPDSSAPAAPSVRPSSPAAKARPAFGGLGKPMPVATATTPAPKQPSSPKASDVLGY